MIKGRILLACVITAIGLAWILVISTVADPFPNHALPAQAKFDGPPSSASVFLPIVLNNTKMVPTAPLWRFGIGQTRRPILEYNADEIAAMRFGWYLDWGARSEAPQPYGMEYVILVRVKQWKDQGNATWTQWCVDCPYAITATGAYTFSVTPNANQIRVIASARPGAVWLIGNEIERRDWYVGRQDEIVPELYAQAYHDIHATIKSADQTAQVAVGGLIEATPLRLQYLDRVWNTYQTTFSTTMPVDIWNIHAFVLQEKSCEAFPSDCWGADIPAGLPDQQGMLYSWLDNRSFARAKDQIIAMRSWMKNKEQQDKPLLISEYGVNFPDWVSPGSFTPEIVRDRFMYPSFNYFLNETDANLGYPADSYRMVQRWNWYSLDDDNQYSDGNFKYNGTLFYSGLGLNPQGLAPLGEYWKQYVQSLPAESTPPYLPVTNVPAVGSVPMEKNENVISELATDCGDQVRVRLLFYEPMHVTSFAPTRTPGTFPVPTKESSVCVNRLEKVERTK